MSVLSQVMMWAVRVNSMPDAKPHQVLDIKPDATLDDAQAAFHKIARIAHPDLHRTTLNAEDLEVVTLAYSRAAAAYQDFRTQRMSTQRIRPLAKEVSALPLTRPGSATPPPPVGVGSTPPSGTPTAPPATGSAPSSQAAAQQMSSKALIYYRKAELSLRRGDLKGAILQLKMAIAADPQSSFLRTALAEVESEVSKTPQ